MQRREFIRKSCLGGIAIASSCFLLTDCATMHIEESNDRISIPLSDLRNKKNVVVTSSKLEQKIFIVRQEDGGFRALLLTCTHKGVGLAKKDNLLVCPAHGSSFDFDGKVVSSPAKAPLKVFKTEVVEEKVVVYLS